MPTRTLQTSIIKMDTSNAMSDHLYDEWVLISRMCDDSIVEVLLDGTTERGIDEGTAGWCSIGGAFDRATLFFAPLP